jgi:CubicO group peptidase (beta-lactamase class C family)
MQFTRWFRAALLAAAMMVFTACATIREIFPPLELTMRPELMAEINRMISEAFPDADAPGCAVLVSVDGETIFAEGYGVQSLETGEPNQPDTNFRLASVSKQFTAAAILRLRDQGKLQLDESLVDVFPDFPEYGRAITIRHLLGHTSGVRGYESLMPRDTTVPILDAGVYEIMAAQDSGNFAPGDQYSYSNSGYALLAGIVEARSGQKFADFLRDEFFVPLGMEGTVAFEQGRSTVPRRAYGYRRNDDGSWRLSDQSMTSSVLGDGGIYCSVEDYARWADAWFDGRVLSQESQELAWTTGKLNDGSTTNYGLGWSVEQVDGLTRIYHTGSTSGFNNCARLVPDRRLCVVVLSNRVGPEPAELAAQIETLLLATP